ncbi:hypothetical protein AQUCO_03800155v1 [Aquilegia coerulea]|uniref:Uncharacterized protein n=1 Tax=Aquilegia coerulea TaxID=218851 RepID=A0A2G5CTY9_AQUCA|nr:hypothetical protein AQUCO_03800155v1 [Aquilegia coerulea]
MKRIWWPKLEGEFFESFTGLSLPRLTEWNVKGGDSCKKFLEKDFILESHVIYTLAIRKGFHALNLPSYTHLQRAMDM